MRHPVPVLLHALRTAHYDIGSLTSGSANDLLSFLARNRNTHRYINHLSWLLLNHSGAANHFLRHPRPASPLPLPPRSGSRADWPSSTTLLRLSAAESVLATGLVAVVQLDGWIGHRE